MGCGSLATEMTVQYPAVSQRSGIACVLLEKKRPLQISFFWDSQAGKVAVTAFKDWVSPTHTSEFLTVSTQQSADGCYLVDWANSAELTAYTNKLILLWDEDLGWASRCCPSCPWTTETMMPCPE